MPYKPQSFCCSLLVNLISGSRNSTRKIEFSRFSTFSFKKIKMSHSPNPNPNPTLNLNREVESLIELAHRRLMSNSSHSLLDPDTILQHQYKISLVQFCATSNMANNKEICSKYIEEASKAHSKMVFLPEGFDFISESRKEACLLAEPIDGPLITHYKGMAKKLKIWLSLGGFHRKLEELQENGQNWVKNTHIIIDNHGEIRAEYEKIHLFDYIDPKEDINLKESSYVRPGEEVKVVKGTPIGNIGLGICYDIRFPELALAQRLAGADVLTFPSAFTDTTGEAHWATLNRARAIENQCFVVSAAQMGQHNPKRKSHGYSMVIDPWGKTLLNAGGVTAGVYTVDLLLDSIKSIRRKMPVMDHRKPEIYQLLPAPEPCPVPSPWLIGMNPPPAPLPPPRKKIAIKVPSEKEGPRDFSFVKIDSKFIFLKSAMSFATVNRKCVLPGHVLVIPNRIVPLMEELSQDEVCDLYALVQKVVLLVKKHYSVQSTNVSIQNGPEAGQTMPHVHVHVVPRKLNDMKDNDDIHRMLEKHDKNVSDGPVESEVKGSSPSPCSSTSPTPSTSKSPENVWRKESDMEEEAKALKKQWNDYFT